jgi:hypothetical protein
MAYQAMKEAYTLSGVAMPSMHGVEAASQSWEVGAILVMSSGSLAIGADDPTLATIVGVARTAATGVTGADVIFTPAVPGVVFEAHLDAGSGTTQLAQSMFYLRYGIELTSGKFFLDQSETTAIRATVVGFRDPIGTANGRVYFTFLPNASPFTMTAV